MLTTLFIILLPVLVRSASEVANYPNIPQIKSGEHKILLQTAVGPSIFDFNQSYFVTYTSPPYVGIGLFVFQIQTTGNDLGYKITAEDITTSKFRSHVVVDAGTTFNQLRYMYLSIDKSQGFGVIYFVAYENLTEFTGTVNTKRQSIQNFNDTYDLQNVNLFVPVLNAFSLTSANNEFSVKVDAQPLSESSFSVTVQSNSTLTYVSFYVIWVNQTVLEATHIYYFDVGFIYGENSQQVSRQLDIPSNSFNYYNFIVGANWININSNQVLDLNLYSNPITTATSYNYVRANMVHWLERECRSQTYYYLHSLAKCYDVCPSGYAENTTFLFCQICDYTCKECLSDGTTCTQCDNTTSRFFQNNQSCTCLEGFFDPGVPQCQACDYTCTTCTTSSTNCLTCDSTRQLLNGSCPCLSDRFDTRQNSSQCQLCHYSCQTCENSSTTCTTCNDSAFRILTSKKQCLCQSGYSEEAGVEECNEDPTIDCIETCFTCENSSQVCTSCAQGNNRELKSSSCSCISGYESVSNNLKCTEICGDGKVFEDECDDGNTVDGDGCSSTCQVEANYTCDNSTEPTLCIFTPGYTITLVSLEKYQFQNKIQITFTISPEPPQTSVPTVSGISNVSSSFTLDGGSLVITLQYESSIAQDATATLSMTNVQQTHQFALQSDNGFALNSYTSSNYSLYQAEIILVWVLIGIVWTSTIIFLIIDKNTISWSVELIISIGVVWIGVKGFEKLLLYYHPLTYLQYIFGYNEVFADEDGLLAYVNYGFILNVVPFFIALIALIINKIKNNTLLSQETKKFLFFDFPFAAFAFNSIMVVYGLYTENLTQTFDTTLSIASLCVGVFYLLVLMIMCVFFVLGNESFEAFKTEMLKPWFFVVILWVKICACLGYLFAVQTISLSPIIFLCTSFLTILGILLLKPYLNNLKSLLNQSIIFLSFLAYLLISQVSTAEWSGFAILMFLYLQVFLNIMFTARMVMNSKSADVEDDDEEDEDYEMEIYGKENEEVREDPTAMKVMNFEERNDPTTVKPLHEQML